MYQEDEGDSDGRGDACDSCPTTPNGPNQGTCAKQINPNLVIITWDTCGDDSDCGGGEFCEKEQLDSNGNGIGDACECESDFDCDEDVDGQDLDVFRNDWGRSSVNNPCPPPCNGDPGNEPCEADFDEDCDVDGQDLVKFTEDFGRSSENNPCPDCP